MAGMARSCVQLSLKLLNSVIGTVGVAMIFYALWMIMDWQRRLDGHWSYPFLGPHPPAPWFMYTFLVLGTILCVITCSGYIAAENANCCCLSCYMMSIFLLLMLEAAVTADVYLNYNWEQDFPMDPSGNFNKFVDFIRMNFDFCKWIGLSVVCSQGLCMLFAMILNGLGPHPQSYYDSDDDYSPVGVPLLKNYVRSPYTIGDPIYRSKNDYLNVRINDETRR